MNKYEKWYNNITIRGKHDRNLFYSESHHIIPKSLGGADTLDNRTTLTAREHFICHWLLTKTTEGKDRIKMLNALRMMRAEKQGQKRYNTKITARVYENLKEEYAQIQSIERSGAGNGFYDKHHTEEAKEHIRQKNLGNQITEEQRAKISNSKKGKTRDPFTEEWKENLAKNHKSKQEGFDGSLSDATKDLIRQKAIGRKYSAEVNASKGRPGLKREKKLCLHCNKEVAVNGYARWHGDNCKQIK